MISLNRKTRRMAWSCSPSLSVVTALIFPSTSHSRVEAAQKQLGEQPPLQIHKVFDICMAKSFKKFDFVVSGSVQGVGFRDFVRSTANADGIVGWVKNHTDGTVVGMAQGEEALLEKFKKDLARGPRHASVTDVAYSNEISVPRLQFESFYVA